MTIAHIVAADLMSTDVVTIAPEATLRDAMILMQDAHVGSLPVVDQHDRCIGIISVRDILNCEAAQAESGAEAAEQSLGTCYDPDTDSWSNVAIVGGLDELPNREVREVMSEDLIFVLPDTSVLDVAEAMVTQGLHHILVIDDDRRLRGVISSLDFARLALQTVQ